MGPPSSGGTTVGEILNILDRTDLGGGDRAKALHLFMEASALAYADRGAYLADPAYVGRPGRRAALARVRVGAPRAHRSGGDGAAPGPGRRPAPLRRRAAAGHRADDPAHGQHDAPHRRRRRRQRRLLHVHHRADRRQRDRRSRPRVPAQQRADGLLHRRPGRAEPRRGRQAPALVDGADDRRSATASRSSRSGRRAARRSSPRSPRCSYDRLGLGSPLPAAMAAPRVSERNAAEADAEPGSHRLARGPGAGVDVRPRASTRSTRSAPSRPSSGSATAGCSPRRSRCAAEAGPPGW